MVPTPDPVEPLPGSGASDEPSEPVASEREKSGRTAKRRSSRSELYKRMKRVDPGLARKYRQLEGQ